jgi:lipopolysaccharide/colanic/teichoic acid biosynthesis glycosyltransferase
MSTKWSKIIKRTIDISLCLPALLLLSPVLILIGLAIKLTSLGSVLYRWKIIGKDGRRVISYKFRTMIQNAEEIEKELRAKGINEMNGVYFKLKNDPRITRVGWVLRKYSLDDLPSLWSILKGDMSLVGPRPVRWLEYDELEEWHKERFRVKPGATSLWVVSGKNEISNFDEVMKLDLEYINNWSLWLDFKIIARTIPIILFGKNH